MQKPSSPAKRQSDHLSNQSEIESFLETHLGYIHSGEIPEDFHKGYDEDSITRRHMYSLYVQALTELARYRREMVESDLLSAQTEAMVNSARRTAAATIWIAIFTLAVAVTTIIGIVRTP